MRIDQLKYLTVLSTESSFNTASEHLNISVQALTASINSLEKELGYKLFERTNKGINITEEGEIFCEFSREVIEKYNRCLKNLSEISQNKSSSKIINLNIYTNKIYEVSILPIIVQKYKKINTNVNISVYTYDNNQILLKLNHNKKDSEIGLITFREDDIKEINEILEKDIKINPFFYGRFIFFTTSNSPLAKMDKVSIKTILKYPLCILHAHNTNDYKTLKNMFSMYGELNIAFATSSYKMWLDSVRNNIGIGLIQSIAITNSSCIQEELRGLTRIKTKEKIEMISACVFNKKDETVSDFINMLKFIT